MLNQYIKPNMIKCIGIVIFSITNTRSCAVANARKPRRLSVSIACNWNYKQVEYAQLHRIQDDWVSASSINPRPGHSSAYTVIHEKTRIIMSSKPISEKEMEMHREYMKKYKRKTNELDKDSVRYQDHYEMLGLKREATHAEVCL